jgi:hypothetical protein
LYLKNRIIFFFYFFMSFIFFLPFSSYQSISFCFRWFRFAFVGFVLFRWFRFVSFLLISFRFVFVDFVSFRFYFVSHFIGTQIDYPMSINHWLWWILWMFQSEFLTKVVGRIWEFLVYEVIDLKEFDLCLLYLIDNRE